MCKQTDVPLLRKRISRIRTGQLGNLGKEKIIKRGLAKKPSPCYNKDVNKGNQQKERIDTMEIREFTVHEFHFTEPEREILEAASELALGMIEGMEQNGVDEYLNPNTGEIFDLEDLYRMRGVIGALVSKDQWMRR